MQALCNASAGSMAQGPFATFVTLGSWLPFVVLHQQGGGHRNNGGVHEQGLEAQLLLRPLVPVSPHALLYITSVLICAAHRLRSSNANFARFKGPRIACLSFRACWGPPIAQSSSWLDGPQACLQAQLLVCCLASAA